MRPKSDRATGGAVRFLHLVALCLGVAVAAELIRAAARTVGHDLAFGSNRPGMLAVYALAGVCVLAFVRYVWGVSPARALARYWAHRGRALRGFLLGFAVVAATLVIAYGLASWAGVATWHATRWQGWGWMMAGRTLIALATAILVATAEECLFRGFGFGYLRGDGAWAAGAVVGSSLIFAFAHRLDDPLAWLAPRALALFVGLVLVGVLLATVYWASGSLTAAVGVHTGLLLAEIFARNRGTRLVFLSNTTWWMGTGNDLRTAPIVWLALLASAVGMWWARDRVRDWTGLGPAEAGSGVSGLPSSLPPSRGAPAGGSP